jgi:hypothetical protein
MRYFLLLCIFAFVVNASDLDDITDTKPFTTTTPSPSPMILQPDFNFDPDDNISDALVVDRFKDADDEPDHPQKKKQQDIAKAVKADTKPHNKNRRSKAAASTTVDAKNMVCSIVNGNLVCYSVNQDDVVFDAAECVVAPNAPDKAYTICSRPLV